jgi:hypothetical protein
MPTLQAQKVEVAAVQLLFGRNCFLLLFQEVYVTRYKIQASMVNSLGNRVQNLFGVLRDVLPRIA